MKASVGEDLKNKLIYLNTSGKAILMEVGEFKKGLRCKIMETGKHTKDWEELSKKQP